MTAGVTTNAPANPLTLEEQFSIVEGHIMNLVNDPNLPRIAYPVLVGVIELHLANIKNSWCAEMHNARQLQMLAQEGNHGGH